MSHKFPFFNPGKSVKPGFHCDIRTGAGKSTGTGKSRIGAHSKSINM